MPDANAQDRPWFQASWGRLEQIVEQFEGAWQSGQEPAIDAYLHAADVEPRKLLVELAHADLECRLKAGEAARVEVYFERYAELAADRRTALGLIAAEYNMRRRREPGLALEEYLQRFPQYRADLPERLPGPHQRQPELPRPSSAQRLGQFELLEAVGQGGFGTVYRARDVELDRIVAVKVPRGDRSITAADEDRFTREARNAAQLTHPSIVPVYEVGHDAALPYIVSAYVEGTTLADALTAQRLDCRQTAEVVAQVAEALDHAHRHGVIHRDLKPSNIMLGRIQGSGVRGQGSGIDEKGSSLTPDPCPLTPGTRAFVMDFGLARREEGEIRLTVEGQILGTPAYMSPEQARGQSHRVDGRSDMYSLGVILYELLTSELPFRGTARMVLQQILDDEPRPPRRINDKVPRDLETIALKCMAKEPGRRYPTAAELAADLRRHLDGAPILARPVGRFERTWLWSKRNRRVAILGGAVLLLLVVVAIGGPLAAIVITVQKNAAVRARAQADKSAKDAQQSLSVALEALDKLVNEVQEQLHDQPALFELREVLLQKALTGLERVAAITKDADTDPNMSSAHERLGDIFLQLGRAAEAREQYERFLMIRNRRAPKGAWQQGFHRPVVVATAKLGEACLRLNDIPAALDWCQQAVAMAETLAKANPQNLLAARDLALCSNRFGAVEMRRGEISAAAEAFARAVEMAQKAVDGHPRGIEVKQDLAAAYENLGDAHIQLGKVPKARAAYEQAMQLRMTLAADLPKNPRAKRDLSVCCERLGDIGMRSNDARAAQLAYGKALEQREQLAAAAPKNSLAHADVSVAYGKLGEASEGLGDLPTARAYFEKALEPLERLATVYSSDARLRRDCAVAYLKLAVVNRGLGEGAVARIHRQKALALFEKAATSAPENLQAQADLAGCCGDLGRTEMKAREYALALGHLEQSVAILRQLELDGKLKNQPGYQAFLRERQQDLDFCRDAQRAIDDLNFALGQPPGTAIKLLSIRAAVFAGKSQPAEAARTAEKLRGVAPNDPDAWYEVACCYALCVPGKPMKLLTTEEAARREKYTALTIEALNEAIKRGFKKVSQLKTDPNFAAIRGSSDFQKLLQRLEANLSPTAP